MTRNNLAYLLLESGGDAKRALRLAQEARRELPRSPLVADTLGYAFLRTGDPGAAQALFFEALGRFDANSVHAMEVNVHLAEAEHALGENDKARARLQRVLARLGPGAQAPSKGSEPAFVGRARSLLAELEGR